MKKVAIIITTFNQDVLLEKCIDSLRKKTDYKNYRIFLVDDSSKNKLGERIKKKFPFVDVTINKTNLGFSKANNIGIKKAIKEYDPDYVLLLNDDTGVVQQNWLSEMIKVGESDPKIGILGCKLIYPDGSLQWFAKNSKIFFFTKSGVENNEEGISKIQKVDNVIGAFFLIKRKVINKIGLLDEKFSPFYGEETDFCYRTKKAGFDNIYVGNIGFIHFRNKSISKLSEDAVWLIKKRNSIRLEWLNFGILKIIKYSLVHFGSIFKKKPIKRFFILIKAYLENIRNFKEIKRKRMKRNKRVNFYI